MTDGTTPFNPLGVPQNPAGGFVSSTVLPVGVPPPSILTSLGQDIAILKVRGMEFQDWESVYVQTRWHDKYDYCRFTAAERREDLVPYWTLLQFKPCDAVEVWLSGQLAMTGTLIERQVAYDVDNHGVQLLGQGTTEAGFKSSVNSETGAFDKMSFEAIARKALQLYGKVNTLGRLNPLEFDKVQNNPGENIWNFLEPLARVRGIIMASTKDGDFLFVGDRTGLPSTVLAATLKEGVNIKSANCTINVAEQFLIYRTKGQTAASNDQYGTAASEQVSDPLSGTGCHVSLKETMAEQPVKSKAELNDRNHNEWKWAEMAKIYLTVVVQGWTYNGINLWEPGLSVWVYSPMCMLNQKMSIQRCTFTQDRNSGSQSTLDCVQPGMLNDGDIEGLYPQGADDTPAKPAVPTIVPFF
jgi:prophage tail gpP-like protein